MYSLIMSFIADLMRFAEFATSPLAQALVAGTFTGALAMSLAPALLRPRNAPRELELGQAPSAQQHFETPDCESILQALLGTLSLGVRRYDRTTSAVYISPAFAALWQNDESKLATNPLAWLESVHHIDRNRVEQAWKRGLDGQNYDEQYRVCRRDGSERWIRERACSRCDEPGDSGSVVFIAEDVTIRRTLEAHVRRSDRLFSLGKVATGIAHDMSDPLATIVLLSGLALHDQDDLEDKNRSLRRIHAEALRSTGIARGLLQFARDDTFEKEYAELNSTVRDAARLLEQHTRESGAVVNLRLEKNLPTLRINHVAIQQILVNLLKNSCDAGAKVIEVFTSRTAAGYRVSVEDDGSGISTAVKDHVFEAFYTTRAEHGGTGIGLAIAQEIVADHDGLIHAEVPPTGGTRIVVDFPKSIGRGDGAS